MRYRRYLPFYVIQLHISEGVEGSFLEVDIMKVGVHVQTRRTKVVSPRNVRDHTF